jgi:dolichol-phosphate mannosyltransferase
MRGLVQWLGFPTTTVQFLPAERPAGQTKYNLFRLLALASDGIFSFSRAPLRIATYLGLVAMALGVCHSVYLVGQGLLGWDGPPLAWSYLLVTTHFLGGAILCCLGIVGEYVGRIFEQVKERPVYLLKDQSPESVRPRAATTERDAA